MGLIHKEGLNVNIFNRHTIPEHINTFISWNYWEVFDGVF